MPTITQTLHIHAPAARVHAAITSEEGLRGWWTRACDVDARVGGLAEFRFMNGARAMRFRVDAIAPHQVRWTCVGHRDNPEWEGTRVAFDLAGDGDGTTLRFAHDGWSAESGVFQECVKGWTHFMQSLKGYVETGAGQPFADAAPVCAAPRAGA